MPDHPFERELRESKRKSRARQVTQLEQKKYRELLETLRQNKERSDFLSEASLLLSESMDHETNLALVGKLAVPQVASLFSIHAFIEPAHLRLVSVTPEGSPTSWYVDENNTQFGAFKALEASHFELLQNLTPQELTQWIPHPWVGSILFIPLRSRGKLLGIMTLIRNADEPLFCSLELEMLQDLARRIAVAMDNSLLYLQAQDAIRVRDDFFSIASHELKTPLTPLKIQLQGLMRILAKGALSTVSPEKIAKMIETSDKQLGKLAQLIEDLLDISRISVGQLSLRVEEFDLIDLVKEVIVLFSGQAASSTCRFQFDAPPSIQVVWDRFRMEQVMVNLIANALKYGADKPIQVSVKQVASRVIVSVRDFGMGVAKADQERIFKRFEKAVSGDHFGGLGLGLYIVTQIVHAHHGSVHLESELGEGSLFTVEVPAQLASQ